MLFAAGQIGWCLAMFGFSDLIYMFYLPPENEVPLFKTFVYQGPIFQIFTIIGLLTAVGYIISAFMEPIVAALSDRSNFKFGKRKTFMAIGVLPYAIFSVLVFFPIDDFESTRNIVWLAIATLIAFTVKCFYTTPYNAMINEVGKTEKDRLHLIMLLSVAYAIGIGLGNLIHVIIKSTESFMSHESAFQMTILVYAAVAFIFMCFPIFFVEDKSNENSPTTSSEKIGLFTMMKEVWKNKNFRIFAITELIYWFPSKIFVIAVPYFVTALLKLDNFYTTIVLYACGVGSFLLYPMIDKLVDKYGKKKIMLSAFLFLILSYAFTASIGLYKMPTIVFVALYIMLNIYPTAVLGILPMALAGDIAQQDMQETGIAKNASYYGFKTFMMKIGVALTSLIFPSLLLLGKTPENPIGVRLVAFTCVVASILAYLVMRKFRDIRLN